MNVYIENAHDIIHETSVDFVLRPCVKEVHIVQYDKSLPVVKVELFKNGERYVLPNDCDVRVKFGKFDHTFVYTHVLGCNEERNAVYFQIEAEMTVFAGRMGPVLEIKYTEEDRFACSSPIPFVIIRNPIQDGDVESSSYAPIFVELEAEVADHEVRISRIEGAIIGDFVSLHSDQYNIDGKKGFTSDVYIDSTGTLSLRFTPTSSQHAITKGYLDQAIEDIEIRSDVIDVLGSYNDLENYDTSDVRLNDLIKVISDETHDDSTTYYRWQTVEETNQWVFVAAEGPYYTITQINSIVEDINDDIEDLDDRKLELHSFNGFVGGTQVHDQISNGQIMYCQSGTQTEIDPSQSPLIQIRLDQSSVSSVSNRKAMYIKQIVITYELDSDPGVEQVWNFEITSRLFTHTSGGADIDPKTVTLTDPVSGVSLDWSLIYLPTSGKTYYGSYDNTKGQQFGSGSNPAELIILQTTSLQNCTVKDIKVYVSGASNTQATTSVNAALDQWDVDGSYSPTITSSNAEYEFTHGVEGTHLGSGSGTTITYEHIFLKKEDGDVTTVEPHSDYLYIMEDGSNDNYRLYKYVNLTMQEVSKTRLGTTSDTAYRGDYGQDNYNKITEVRSGTFTFTGYKTFANPVNVTAGLYYKDSNDNNILFVLDQNADPTETHVLATQDWVEDYSFTYEEALAILRTSPTPPVTTNFVGTYQYTTSGIVYSTLVLNNDGTGTYTYGSEVINLTYEVTATSVTLHKVSGSVSSYNIFIGSDDATSTEIIVANDTCNTIKLNVQGRVSTSVQSFNRV